MNWPLGPRSGGRPSSVKSWDWPRRDWPLFGTSWPRRRWIPSWTRPTPVTLRPPDAWASAPRRGGPGSGWPTTRPYSPYAADANAALSQTYRDGAPDWVALLETWNDRDAQGDAAHRSFLLGQRLLEAFGQPLAARRLLDQALTASPDASWRDQALLLRAQTHESNVQTAVTAYREAAQAMSRGTGPGHGPGPGCAAGSPGLYGRAHDRTGGNR